jgi:flagellar basal body-associated protein FliL
MRKLIFTLMLILAGYVGYMYFFGKGEDKEKAQLIVNETKDLGKAVGDFLSKQKDKYDDGEFDRLIDNVSSTLQKLKSDQGGKSDELKDELRELQRELKQIDPSKLNEENRKALEKTIQDIEQQLES